MQDPNAMMRGYIALSPALDADGVLIARPFSPMLFRLGPQPFATLLLETLQGKHKEEDLPRKWAEAVAVVRDSTKNQRLLDSTWKCGVCHELKEGRDYDCSGAEWDKQFLTKVLAPGHSVHRNHNIII